jgi:putative transposase
VSVHFTRLPLMSRHKADSWDACRAIDDGLIYHALNRGNNRADVYTEDGNREAFLEAMGHTHARYPFKQFSCCLMTNDFHLLLPPEPGQSISRILQPLTVAHTWPYHRRH